MNEIISAPVIAALVPLAGSAIGKIITWIGNRKGNEKADADAVIEKTYATLRSAFTDGCVRVLHAIENGQLAHATRMRELVYADLPLPPSCTQAFEGELRYRLEYLRLHGVLAPVGPSEYGITSLGEAFLEQARRKHHYSNVLF